MSSTSTSTTAADTTTTTADTTAADTTAIADTTTAADTTTTADTTAADTTAIAADLARFFDRVEDATAEPPAYRAYDQATGWSGPPRTTAAAAAADARRHNRGCAAQGGYGRAIVAVRAGDRLVGLDGEPIWPSHGKSCGAARWV
jgi:hypothetical protein